MPGSFWKKQGKKNKVSQLLKMGTFIPVRQELGWEHHSYLSVIEHSVQFYPFSMFYIKKFDKISNLIQKTQNIWEIWSNSCELL